MHVVSNYSETRKSSCVATRGPSRNKYSLWCSGLGGGVGGNPSPGLGVTPIPTRGYPVLEYTRWLVLGYPPARTGVAPTQPGFTYPTGHDWGTPSQPVLGYPAWPGMRYPPPPPARPGVTPGTRDLRKSLRLGYTLHPSYPPPPPPMNGHTPVKGPGTRDSRVPGKEQLGRSTPPLVNGRTPVKILPSPSFGFGR